MKSGSNNSNTHPQSNQPPKGPANNNKQRPENKDNLDSREGEEQEVKGDDVTHNKKETKADHLKKK